MSKFYDIDALFDNYNDDHEYDDPPSGPREPAHTATCKHCGLYGLKWEQDEDGWYLMDDKGYQHECEDLARHNKMKREIGDIP